MSTSRNDLTMALPPALPPALPRLPGDSLLASAGRGYRAFRRRWKCMGPSCGDRRLRSLLPARIQLQQGWCCSPECFQEAFQTLAVEHLRTASVPVPPHRHRVPLGLLLLSRGLINQAQLRQALELQSSYGTGRVGDWLVRNGALSEEDVAAGVALQWSRPIFRLPESSGWHQCRGWVPLTILETLRMLPLHFALSRRRLYMGFTQSIDFHACAALAMIFECKLEACIVTDSTLDNIFEQLRGLSSYDHVQDIAFDHIDEAAEISGIVRQYAQYTQARQIRLAPVGPFLWVRIHGQKIIHLTFRAREVTMPAQQLRQAASA